MDPNDPLLPDDKLTVEVRLEKLRLLREKGISPDELTTEETNEITHGVVDDNLNIEFYSDIKIPGENIGNNGIYE